MKKKKKKKIRLEIFLPFFASGRQTWWKISDKYTFTYVYDSHHQDQTIRAANFRVCMHTTSFHYDRCPENRANCRIVRLVQK